MKRINCETTPEDYIEVMPTWDEDCQRVLNIEINTIEDEGLRMINLSVESAKELIKELQEFISNEEGN